MVGHWHDMLGALSFASPSYGGFPNPKVENVLISLGWRVSKSGGVIDRACQWLMMIWRCNCWRRQSPIYENLLGYAFWRLSWEKNKSSCTCSCNQLIPRHSKVRRIRSFLRVDFVWRFCREKIFWTFQGGRKKFFWGRYWLIGPRMRIFFKNFGRLLG